MKQSLKKLSTLVFTVALVFGATGALAEQAEKADPSAAKDPRIGDWSIHCVDKKDDKPGCFIYQNLFNKENKQLVMRVAIGFLDRENGPVSMLTLPLGVGLRAGVLIQVDDNKGGQAPYEYCDKVGCRVTMKLGDDAIATMRKGKVMNVSFATVQRQKVTVPVSLNGFSKALDEVLKKNGIKK